MSGQERKRVKMSALPTYPFETDFCDHFETPLEAYQHIVPMLEALCAHLKRPKKKLQIYDPYFCTGKMREHLRAVGFPLVFNEPEDFYAVVKADEVPSYDILLTNPPYSGDHKERCLQFCVQSGLPFALLMPCYVSVKQYFTASGAKPFYIVPNRTYQYLHPTGAGHDESHFESMWFVCANTPGTKTDVLLEALQQSQAYSPANSIGATIQTVTDLVSSGVVVTKRKNPKRRKREKMQRAANRH
eukprot:m.7968 g.7968  ORF g.7968 m.7968 type:complete len:244 (-) comp5137_c0_seq1:185-916(-)